MTSNENKYWQYAYTPLQTAVIYEMMRARYEDEEVPEIVEVRDIRSDGYAWNAVVRDGEPSCAWLYSRRCLHADGSMTDYDSDHLPPHLSPAEAAMGNTLHYDDLRRAAERYYHIEYPPGDDREEMYNDARRWLNHATALRRNG